MCFVLACIGRRTKAHTLAFSISAGMHTQMSFTPCTLLFLQKPQFLRAIRICQWHLWSLSFLFMKMRMWWLLLQVSLAWLWLFRLLPVCMVLRRCLDNAVNIPVNGLRKAPEIHSVSLVKAVEGHERKCQSPQKSKGFCFYIIT